MAIDAHLLRFEATTEFGACKCGGTLSFPLRLQEAETNRPIQAAICESCGGLRIPKGVPEPGSSLGAMFQRQRAS